MARTTRAAAEADLPCGVTPVDSPGWIVNSQAQASPPRSAAGVVDRAAYRS